MKRKHFAYFVCMVVITVWSCGHVENKKETSESENKVLQEENGTVSLDIEKAGCYTDIADPSNNTADWNVVISKPGRFKVWLSSATKDTADLSIRILYRISLLDNHLEGNPACDKIVHNANEVDYPYFRADSYMGSIYVSEPGEYNIQVISEKVTSKNMNTQLADTKLLSVMLISRNEVGIRKRQML